MPIYEYKCKACGHTFEAIQKMTDRPLRRCTECAGAVKKQVSRASFHLKGGGWYDSAYSKAPSPSSAAGDTKPATGASTPASGDKTSGTSESDSPSSLPAEKKKTAAPSVSSPGEGSSSGRCGCSG